MSFSQRPANIAYFAPIRKVTYKSPRAVKGGRMEGEKEKVLQEEVGKLEEQLKILAEKIQVLTGIDCSFGSCVFDPEMTEVEQKISEVQRRKRILERIMNELEACELSE